MIKQSENLHASLAEICDNLKCSFFEACIYLCQENEIDPEDLIGHLDSITMDRLKQSAIDERMIRKKNIKLEIRQLPFE